MHSEPPYDSLYDEEYEEILNLDGKIVSTETLRLADFEVIKNDLKTLIDLAFVTYTPDFEVIMYLKYFDKIEVFKRTVEMVTHNPNLVYKSYRIMGKVVGKVAGEWLKEQWEKCKDRDLRFFAEPLIECLDFDEAFEIITMDIERSDIGNVGPEIEELLHFKNEKVLDWIESVSERITIIKTLWGHLAAGSNFSWERAENWLNSGRPLSLIALDALIHCTTIHRRTDRFYYIQPKRYILTDHPSYERVANRLHEFLLHDDVPRSSYTVKSILENMSQSDWNENPPHQSAFYRIQ
ncbi:MAG: hypothetical protein IPM69_11860 [Ignavibacteria bacterium]|nr:hypothetical protein [Ignavibacteria bacterium]